MAKLTTLEGLDMSDNYVKYGALAAGGILLYMLMQKQGLGDVLKTESDMEIEIGEISPKYIHPGSWAQDEDEIWYWEFDNGVIVVPGTLDWVKRGKYTSINIISNEVYFPDKKRGLGSRDLKYIITDAKERKKWLQDLQELLIPVVEASWKKYNEYSED